MCFGEDKCSLKHLKASQLWNRSRFLLRWFWIWI